MISFHLGISLIFVINARICFIDGCLHFLFLRSAIDSVFGDFFSVSNYTREAGVRSLERKIGGVCRAVAVQVWI